MITLDTTVQIEPDEIGVKLSEKGYGEQRDFLISLFSEFECQTSYDQSWFDGLAESRTFRNDARDFATKLGKAVGLVDPATVQAVTP